MASPSIATNKARPGRSGPIARLRLAIRISAMLGAILLCVPLHYLWRLFRAHSPWPRIFLHLISLCYGARATIVGPRVERDVFYVCNHLSWCDIPIIAGATGSAFIARADMGEWPVVGWLCRLNNTVFVEREARLKVGAQIESLRAAIEEHQPVTIFPEGTTSDGRSLLPFKQSLFAVMTPPPRAMLVQPMLIDYGDAGPEIAWTGEETMQANAKRLLSRRGKLPVRLEFLEPFDPADYADRKAIAAEARARIETALNAGLARAEHV